MARSELARKLLQRRRVMWAPSDEPPGLEDLLLTFRDEGATASGLILRGGTNAVRFRYLAEADRSWRLRNLRLQWLGEGFRDGGWGLAVDEDGTWRNDDGGELPYLSGCVGVDMSRTPMPKTLLLRRLELAVGETAEVDVAHIGVPELPLRRRHQRYTRLSERKYRCEGPDSTVSCEDDPVREVVHDFEVDEDGLVLDWPGHFRRVWTFDREKAARDLEQIIERFERNRDSTNEGGEERR